MISVVIPVYNAERFLAKCLEHLVRQTYQDLEIIIVDDGSTDNTPQIYQQYADRDKRIKIIRQQNAGPAAASNTGMDAATGQYIHFHDHDDWVNLEYFQRMADVANQTNADILCGMVNQPEYNFPRFQYTEILTSMRDKILVTRANQLNPAWRYVYKKEFLVKNNLRFDPNIFGAQDLFFTKPAIVLAHSVATVPGAIYNVVDTDTALGKSRKKLQERNTSQYQTAAWNKMNEMFREHGADGLMQAPFSPNARHTFKMFNMNIVRREIFDNKIRYYLFGINVGTKRLY